MPSCFDLTDRLVTLVRDEGSKLQIKEHLDCCGTEADCTGRKDPGLWEEPGFLSAGDVVATEPRRIPKAASKDQSRHLYLPVPGASQALCRPCSQRCQFPFLLHNGLSGSSHKPKLRSSHLFLRKPLSANLSTLPQPASRVHPRRHFSRPIVTPCLSHWPVEPPTSLLASF